MGSLGKQLRMAFFHHLDIVRSQGPLRQPTLGPSWAPAAVWLPALGPRQGCGISLTTAPPGVLRPGRRGCPRLGCPSPLPTPGPLGPRPTPTPLPQALASSGSPSISAGTESPRPRRGL